MGWQRVIKLSFRHGKGSKRIDTELPKKERQSMDVKTARKQLCDLIKKDALVKKKVILASGKESSVYIDIRKVSLQSEGSYLIGRLIWDLIKDERIKALGGPTIGADPIIAAVLYHAHLEHVPLNGFIIRTAQKKHGMMNLVEGPVLSKQHPVVLVDDVVTTGGSLKNAIEMLEKDGITIKKIIAVLDREEEKQFDAKRYGFNALFTLSELL